MNMQLLTISIQLFLVTCLIGLCNHFLIKIYLELVSRKKDADSRKPGGLL